MINRLSSVALGLVMVSLLVFVVTGCQRGYKKLPAGKPKVQSDIIIADYAGQAIEAAGGFVVWQKAERLKVDYLATFYRPQSGFYLTENHYEICPWSGSIRVNIVEPQGKFVWQLSKGRFSVLEGAEMAETLPIPVSRRDLAELVLDIITVPVRLLDESVQFARGAAPVKKKGQWYYPIKRTAAAGSEKKDVEPYWSGVVFYQNADSFLVDMLWFADVNSKKFLAVRGYNYQEIEKSGVRIPGKIEIFRTDAAGIVQQRLVKIDLIGVR